MKKSFNFIAVILVLLGFSLPTYSLTNNNCTCNQKNAEAVIKLIDEVWNKGNFQIVDQLIAPKYIIRHDPGDQWENKTIDLATYKNRVKMSRDVLPDQKFHIEDLVCQNDKVAVSWKFTGTQKGDLPGLPATNKTVSISGLTIYYFSEEKIIGHWQVIDKLNLFRQLRGETGKH